ncbi:hypothetical protein GCM10025867_43070 [Frondihabitans sucicola]|uniref:SAM-dependent methyltransferase n=1 Tax=Frondihabitans sucicola TaxID=1268041 RepID=A0ABM8GUD9_9MICO|nr:hypothetical protein GCM10025867_43070 [Frondihabitans sucicola]
MLHDWNDALTRLALEGDPPTGRDGHPVSLRSSTGSLADIGADDLAGAGLVTASALLDVLTFDEVSAIVRACVEVGTPALFGLSVTGRIELDPPDARDRVIEAAFNAHQQRSEQGRGLLGPTGASVARNLFETAGWQVASADTFWRLGPREPELLDEWFTGWVGAAVEQDPALRADRASYVARRELQASRGELFAVVHHLDVLASPR